ncbi:MAG: ABC transporter ATP-binding protein [Candidatus Heimdallarchaeaceae archaeon]
MTTKNIVEFRHVKKNYYIKDNTIEVLRDVNFTIKEGESVCLLGRSGTGKTTTLNLLSALDYPTSGEILIEGRNIHAMDHDKQSEYRLLNMGYIFQEFHLLEHYSALENVMAPLILAGNNYDDAREQSFDLINMVQLSEKALSLPSELSSGQKQRISVARAIANNPKILIADEPTGMLDTRTSDAIMDLLLSITAERHMTMIYTTHDPYLAQRATRILILHNGKIIKSNLSPKTLDPNEFYELYNA